MISWYIRYTIVLCDRQSMYIIPDKCFENDAYIRLIFEGKSSQYYNEFQMTTFFSALLQRAVRSEPIQPYDYINQACLTFFKLIGVAAPLFSSHYFATAEVKNEYIGRIARPFLAAIGQQKPLHFAAEEAAFHAFYNVFSFNKHFVQSPNVGPSPGNMSRYNRSYEGLLDSIHKPTDALTQQSKSLIELLQVIQQYPTTLSLVETGANSELAGYFPQLFQDLDASIKVIDSILDHSDPYLRYQMITQHYFKRHADVANDFTDYTMPNSEKF